MVLSGCASSRSCLFGPSCRRVYLVCFVAASAASLIIISLSRSGIQSPARSPSQTETAPIPTNQLLSFSPLLFLLVLMVSVLVLVVVVCVVVGAEKRRAAHVCCILCVRISHCACVTKI